MPISKDLVTLFLLVACAGLTCCSQWMQTCQPSINRLVKAIPFILRRPAIVFRAAKAARLQPQPSRRKCYSDEQDPKRLKGLHLSCGVEMTSDDFPFRYIYVVAFLPTELPETGRSRFDTSHVVVVTPQLGIASTFALELL